MTGFMAVAIEEARQSLREGNCGFGAVVVCDGEIVASAHDAEKTQQDPTAHAEITAIRAASAKLGRHLEACTLISTHEPCPMCATAALWSGITTLAYGFSIKEAMEQGRRRIDLSCEEIFRRAGRPATIRPGVIHEECASLYNRQVRDCIDELRDADEEQIALLAERLSEKRLAWFGSRQGDLDLTNGTLLERAYELFLTKLSISSDEAPIVECTPKRVVIHSRNFCPTLEACKILGLDTRHVCSRLTEAPMGELLKRLDPRLRFSRNYEFMRPYSEYCEEVISLSE